MVPSPHIAVRIDLGQVRRNVQVIRSVVGVPLMAVIKADAYGLGAAPVATAIADLVDGFCVFGLAEAVEAQLLRRTGKHALALGPDADPTADDYIAQGVRPAVWDERRASLLRRAHPVLSVDTGMQRFSCPPEQIDRVLKAGECTEAFTHAISLDRVERLLAMVGNRGLKLHAAGSSLMHEAAARLDCVRPGIALYRGAARIHARLADERKSSGPAGYGGFSTPRHGVILGGYSNGLRVGPCVINGRRSRVLEVGMQSSFVETTESDRVGDEVVLLGEGLQETDVAAAWKSSPHEALTRLCGAGVRRYIE
ncbi:MAG TPA: alanine racemase [Tepidisphaeraceae bacterium]|nr:alanine racemase [Tepidisphaeraceae bacterium]